MLDRRYFCLLHFTEAQAYKFESQQDAMTYVRNFDRPDVFITVTTNPAWPEILDSRTATP